MSFYFLIGIAATLWLITLAAGLLALRWSFLGGDRRFLAGVILSALAIASSYLGVTRLRITGSQTVNGHLRWRIDSKWFFMASLVLGVVALAHTLWKKWKITRPA